MGKLVADIEWSAPLPALTLGEASGVLALVRWNGRPIGLVHVNAFEGIIAPAMLRAAILAQVSLSDLPDVRPRSAVWRSVVPEFLASASQSVGRANARQ